MLQEIAAGFRQGRAVYRAVGNSVSRRADYSRTLMLLSHQYPNQMGHLVIALYWPGAAPLLSCYSLRYFYVSGRERGECT